MRLNSGVIVMSRKIERIKEGWVGVKLSREQWVRFLDEDIDFVSSLLFWESLNYPLFETYSYLAALEGLDEDKENEDFLIDIEE